MTAYAIHVYDFKGKKFIFNFILLIMTIPTQVSALGFFSMCTDWGLRDTYIPLIVPAIAAPAVFFFMIQYMKSSLPIDIIEAARIDGSGEFRTFNTIVLPMLKPALAVQAIFSFVASWNNYFLPSLIIDTSTKKTMPIMIAQLRS
ncbi:sugar ABC transporter permease, partial [human gut metagenome]